MRESIGSFNGVPGISLSETKISITKDYFTIGRADQRYISDYTIEPDKNSISRGEHVAIVYDGYGWYIIDKESKNGTFINEKPVERGKKVPLSNGDRIRLGLIKHNVVFIFSLT